MSSTNFKLEYTWELPEFESYEFSPKRKKYCICVFVINEGERLKNQLQKMATMSEIIDIVVADGGSSDHSTDSELLKKFKVNTLLVKKSTGKLGTQMRMAFAWALRRSYEGVIVIDGNGKDGVEAIPDFIKKLDAQYDHIQGSRFIQGGQHENTPLYRLLALKILHVPLVKLASGFQYTDTTNGFRAYSAKFLRDLKVAVFRNVFTSYELHYYLAIQGPRQGFQCIEVPVKRVYPEGEMPSKITPFKGSFDVLYRLFCVLFGRYTL